MKDHKGTLSLYGEGICRSRFKEVQLDSYEIEVTEYDDVHECNVRHNAGTRVNEVIIPKHPDEYGSRFGKCSCGVHKTKTYPCVHMVAVTKSSKVQGLTRVNIMPSWCYTALWKEQFGEGTVMDGGFDINFLKTTYQPNPKLRYCPKIAAPEKAGRKKNLKRHKGPLEKKGGGTKGRKKKKKEDEEINEDLMKLEEDSAEEEGLVGTI